MSLKELKTARKSNNSSTKTPAFYAQQQKQFIKDMTTHTNPAVRAAALTCEFCPVTIVSSSLLEETDQNVVREILLHGKPTIKSIEDFVDTPMADKFDNDDAVNEAVSLRLAGDPDDEEESEEDILDDDGNGNGEYEEDEEEEEEEDDSFSI